MKFFALIYLVPSTWAYAEKNENCCPKPNCILSLPNKPLMGSMFCSEIGGGQSLLKLCDGLFCTAQSKYVMSDQQDVCSDSGGMPQLAQNTFPMISSSSDDQLASGMGKLLKEAMCKKFRLSGSCKGDCFEKICGPEPFTSFISRKVNSRIYDLVQKMNGDEKRAESPIFIAHDPKAKKKPKAIKDMIASSYLTQDADSKAYQMYTLATGFRYVVVMDAVLSGDKKPVFDIQKLKWVEPKEAYPICN